MIRWVHERASQARSLGRVVVATDDARIRDAVLAFGGEALMTSPSHPSGTDRLAEVARALPGHVFVNVQGDEPLLDPASIDLAVEALLSDETCAMSTLAAPLEDEESWNDPSVVKVVCDDAGRALYFSRAPVPWPRDAAAAGSRRPPAGALRHVGLYAYRRDFLLEFASWGPGRLETTECLEQLRALERGAVLRVAITPRVSLAVDTPADVPRVEAALAALDPSHVGARST